MSAEDVIKQELGTAAGFDTTTTWAQRVLKALRRSGYAVVKLPNPEPEWKVDEGYTALFIGAGSPVRVRWSKDVILDGAWYNASEAREIAAALLAAAEATK